MFKRDSAAALFAAAFLLVPRAARLETAPSLSPEQWAREIVVLTNKERAKRGLPPLKYLPILTAAAQWQAQDMAANNYLEHTDSQGRSIDPRLPDFGYANYHIIGENIAGGQKTPAEVVAGWMNSPHHRENILNPDFSEIGAGYAANAQSKYHRYWVQDFGVRFDAFPVVINNEEGQTRAAIVRLTIYGAGWARWMRLSGDGSHWTRWERYQGRRDWALEPGVGARTVYVETSDGDTIRRAQDSAQRIPENRAGLNTQN